MKKIFAGLSAGSILVFAVYCNKSGIVPGSGSNNNGGNNNGLTIPDTTKPSAVGSPSGPSVSQFISSGGGSLVSADGRLQVIFPAGALPNGETITIQNITNSMESGIGDAYRLLPDGEKFSVPVTVKFSYNDSDLNGSTALALSVAYQDSGHFWQPVVLSSLDNVGRSFSVQTTHFTDWSAYLLFKCLPISGSLNLSKKELMVGRSVTFGAFYASKSNAGFMVPILKNNVIPTYNYTVNDEVGGNSTYGTLADANSGNTGGWSFVYNAPAKVPASNNPVHLRVDPFQAYFDIKDTSGKTVSRYLNSAIDFKIKIVGFPMFRIDIVDWEDMGTSEKLNYYDSASIFVLVDPTAAGAISRTISGDSILNFPPVAYPTTPTLAPDGCTYQWIPEPIGTVNITNASLNYYPYNVGTGSGNQYLVNVSLDNTGANLAWFSVACKNASAVVHKEQKPDYGIPIPFIVSMDDNNYEVMLEGTQDKDHVRVKRVTDMN